MEKLSQSGAAAYYRSTQELYFLGLICWEQVIHRLIMLASLMDDCSFKKDILFLINGEVEDEYIEPYDHESEPCSFKSYRPRLPPDKIALPFHNSPVFALIVTNISGMTEWVFHQYDRDFFPSIPHGHNTDSRRKLDPYLGWIYLGSAQAGRVKRQTITFLWNDHRFRAFTGKSIQWYRSTFPRFHWRVPNPMKLPRKR